MRSIWVVRRTKYVADSFGGGDALPGALMMEAADCVATPCFSAG